MEDSLRLDRIIADLLTERTLTLSTEDVAWLCKGVCEILLDEPSLLEIAPPVNICGDLHGQFVDLLRVFHAGTFNESTKCLFLGDYVDRGDQSLEVICLLFALKMRWPDSVFLLRGNHESPEMTDAFGFAQECEEKLDFSILPFFFDAFDSLPVAAIVGGSIFCVHGGLSPSLDDVSKINEIERPSAIPEEGVLADLLWSDPSPATVEWGPNDRGATYTWGLQAARAFMERNGIQRIIRAHQLAFDGYDFPFAPDESVITVFTASSYANTYTNKAAFITVSEAMELSFTVLDPILADVMQEGEGELGPSTARCYESADVEIDAQ